MWYVIKNPETESHHFEPRDNLCWWIPTWCMLWQHSCSTEGTHGKDEQVSIIVCFWHKYLSYSEYKLLSNDDNNFDSITSLLSDGAGLDLDNNGIDKTSVIGDDVVEDYANDDEGLTFGDFEEDPNDVAPVYVGVFLRETLYKWKTLSQP